MIARSNLADLIFCPHVNTRLTQSFEQYICDFVSISLHALLRDCQVAYDFSLPMTLNRAITQKGSQDLLMSQVLAPRLELFWSLADLLPQMDQGVSETMGIEIREAGADESFAEDRPNG